MAKQINSLLLLCEAISEENSAMSDSKSSSDGESDMLGQPSRGNKYYGSGFSTPSVSPRSVSLIGKKSKSLAVKRRAKHEKSEKGRKSLDTGKAKKSGTQVERCATPGTTLTLPFAVGHLPAQLFSAFNAGDMEALRGLISHNTTENVVLFTKALLGPVMGQEHVMNFFSGLIDGHPDVYILAEGGGMLDETTLQANIVIKGTRALPTALEQYYAKPSLVDNMDLQKMKDSEIRRLRTQEAKLKSSGKPIDVEYKGTMRLVFSTLSKKTTPGRGSGLTNFQITAIIFDYHLKSFEEAIIHPGL